MPDLDVQVVNRFEPLDIYEVYVEEGKDWFNDDNVNIFLSAGNIRGSHIYTQDFEGNADTEREVPLVELLNQDYGLTHNAFLQEALVQRFSEVFPPDGIVVTAGSLSTRYLSDKFIDCLLSGESLFEYFTFDAESIVYNDDYVGKDVREYLMGFGFPDDIFLQIFDDTASEDSELAEYYPEIKRAYELAYADVSEQCAEDECISDFEVAVEDSVPDGGELLSSPIFGCGELKFRVSREFVAANAADILDGMATSYSDDDTAAIDDSVTDLFLTQFGDYFKDNFREPYGGWQGFNEEMFNDLLLDNLKNIGMAK